MDDWSFPLKCAEDLGRLEDSLQENKDLERSLAGHSKDELTANFSYSGQKNKACAASSEEAVRANMQTRGAMDAEMKTVIVIQLKNAKARTSSRQPEQLEVRPVQRS
ncbi:uncharacterized protein LOC144165746 [Haemaphysalis longicornis]